MVEILTRQERSEPKPQGAVSLRETFSEIQAGQVCTGEQPETLQQTETEDLFLEPCEDCDFHRRRCVIVKKDEGALEPTAGAARQAFGAHACVTWGSFSGSRFAPVKEFLLDWFW